MDTIGVIGAMEEEIELLKGEIEYNFREKRAGNTFYIGELYNTRIILLQCGIGKVNAAIGTTLMIQKYDPVCLINTGSAGAVLKSLEVGDVIISSSVVHHDVDVTAFGYEFGQVPKMPNAFLPHTELISMAEKAASAISGLNVYPGVIATGDSFMNDQKQLNELREKFPLAAAAEMEAAAIAQTCHQFRKPFVIIRSISDKADENANIDFKTFIETAADNSATIVTEIIRQLRDYINWKEYSRMQEAFE